MTRSFGGSLLCALLVQGAYAAGGPAYRVADLDAGSPYATGVAPTALTVFDGRLYFAGYTATAGREPWSSDGTAAGTAVVTDLCAGRCWSIVFPELFVAFDGHLYFPACDPSTACRLWRTDGDALEPVSEGMAIQVMPWQGALYYSTIDGELFRTDGAGPGTRVLRADEPLIPWLLIPGDDELFVFAVDLTFTVAPKPPQLWRTDGSPESSRLILGDPRLDVYPLTFEGRALYRVDEPLLLTDGFSSTPLLGDPPFSRPVPLYVIDGTLIVRTLGPELWRTDGTAAGTALLAARDPDPGAYLAQSAVFQGEVYFVIGPQGRALMRTVDLAGTTTVHQFSDPISDLRVVDGSLYVGTESGPFRPPRSLWRIDGLAAAPAHVLTLDEGSFGEVTAFGGDLFFAVWSADGVCELARVGAGGEVERLTRLPFDPSGSPRHLTRHRDRIVFESEDFRKWVSDGTSRGTFELQGAFDPFALRSRRFVSLGEEAVLRGTRDFLTIDEGGDVVRLFEPLAANEQIVPGSTFALDHGVFFFSYDSAGAVDLWRGDPDTGEIERVIELLQRLARPGQEIESVTRGAGALVLLEDKAWWTDGTADGTHQILDVLETCDCLLVSPVAAGSGLFFASRPDLQAEQHTWRLWRSDGAAAGTALVREIEPFDAARGIFLGEVVAVGERIFFVVTDGLSRQELWTSDGTRAGTLPLSDPASGWTAPEELTAFDGRLVFTAEDPVHGRELWTSDGTAAGTELFLDLFPGQRSSSPRHLTVVDGRLVFNADDGVHGAEPWVSDGTRAGTRLLEDLLPGLPPSDPESFTAAGDLVYFNAGDDEKGFELWAMARAALAGDLAAVFTSTPGRAVQGKPIVFADHSAGRPESWCWRFGDEPAGAPECSATAPEARHPYGQPGVYTVTLRVERTLPDGGSESSTASAEVEVEAFCLPCLLE